jgi:hypothetical protein
MEEKNISSGKEPDLLQKKHAELWDELSALQTDQAMKLLNSFTNQVRLQQVIKVQKRDLLGSLTAVFKSPWFYVSLLAGLSFPIMIYVSFIYTSLWIE